MTTFDSFIRAVHRRWIIVRAIERAGLGALMGSVAAGMLLPLLIWQDRPATGVAVGCLVLGFLCGLIVGVTRRPSRLSAAMEVDRQLGLSDVIASADLMRGASSGPWASAVVAHAEAHCQRISANAVILHRLGSRAWGGIGLAAAFVLTLSLMFSQPRPTRADGPASGDREANAFVESHRSTPQPEASTAAGRGQKAAPSPDQRDAASRKFDAVETADVAGDSNNAVPRKSSAQGPSAAASESAGAGAASTEAPHTPLPQPRPGSDASAKSNGEPSATAGSGAASSDASTGDASSGGVSRSRHAAHDTPPWEQPEWAQQKHLADEAIRKRAVPDAYRDVVREYFDPSK